MYANVTLRIINDMLKFNGENVCLFWYLALAELKNMSSINTQTNE